METSTWPRCARDKPHADVASIAHLFPALSGASVVGCDRLEPPRSADTCALAADQLQSLSVIGPGPDVRPDPCRFGCVVGVAVSSTKAAPIAVRSARWVRYYSRAARR
jgi:hypothetical protein